MPVAPLVQKLKFALEELQDSLAVGFHVGLTQRIAGLSRPGVGFPSPKAVIVITASSHTLALKLRLCHVPWLAIFTVRSIVAT
jgi:hypothetical protein